jgi:NhaA family Na+:H+ antiporter
VGFTVALFIAALAYRAPAIADQAKVGIFAGSILAGAIGATILSGSAQPATADETAPLAEPALAEA